ncbi:small metal-binding protein [Nitrosomonas oligotropha]|uniref:Small metal-binding protein n=1 Tax=Nitrosomonas oligotropha TaxID=42354 RepID=A0A2T5I4Z7_9PROT|nr:small metal-binding protein SmbP [Nitrosomonas oligotropha]PTQ78891.1 small metal-binding protein [Nitrosomonas oligotropha]
MKTVTLAICSLILVFTSFNAFSSYSTFAGFDHLSEAILHTYSASRSSNGKTVTKLAEVARIHASATRSDSYRRIDHIFLNEGIRYLNLAVKEGKNGNTDAAKQAVNNALLFLIQSVSIPVVFRRINDDG